MAVEDYEIQMNDAGGTAKANPYVPYGAGKEEDSRQAAETYLDNQLDLFDKPFSIPDTIKPLVLGGGRFAVNKEDMMEHDITLDIGSREYTYNMVGALNKTPDRQLLDPGMVTRAFIDNLNELLAVNNITTLVIDVSPGIGTKVGGVAVPGRYVTRLTAKFKINELGKKRIAAIEGVGHYAITDPNNNNSYPLTLPGHIRAASSGMTGVEKEVEAGNQKAKVSFFYKELTVEKPKEKRMRIGSAREMLSSEAMKSYPIFRDGKQVGSIMKCEAQPGWKPKVMFANAMTNPGWFTKNGTDYFPNIAAIEKGIDPNQTGTKKVMMVTTGPYYQSGTTMSGVAYVDGRPVGSEPILQPNGISDGRAVANINQSGVLQIQHASELGYNSQQQTYDNTTLKQYIGEKRDIVTMSSLIRSGNVNMNASLRNHPNAHSIVSFADGTWGEVVINGVDAATKQAIMRSLMNNQYLSMKIDRAMYADGDAYQNYLDGIFVRRKTSVGATSSDIVYSHPNRGDVMTNTNAISGAVVTDNMPGVMIFYSEKE